MQNHALCEIENILLKVAKTLKEIDGMPLPDSSLIRDVGNRLLNEELNYDCSQFKNMHEELYIALNTCQKTAYEVIIDSVANERGQLFFMSDHGGIEKTYLWKTIILKLRSESKIVLPVASSSIAALLLPNGRTAHSRFHIPLDIIAESSCEIRHGTQLADLLCKTSLIIWDEAPMANKFCLEALDKSLRDILRSRCENSNDKPFRGITIVLGGDFRQILPVIPKGRRTDIVDASLNSSYLWQFFNIYELKQNMRLSTGPAGDLEAHKVATFDKWLLQIGDGTLYDHEEKELVKIPIYMILEHDGDPIKSIVQAVYPSLQQNYRNFAYFKERAILTPKNETVHQLNEFIMELLPGEGTTYLSSDSICKTTVVVNDEDMLYTAEFLNNLKVFRSSKS